MARALARSHACSDRADRALVAPEPVALRVTDVAPGLWIWRVEHPDWEPGLAWEPPVTSTCVESGGEVAVLDPLAPRDAGDAGELWARLDRHPLSLVAVLKPDHVRDVDLVVRRYRPRAFGPRLLHFSSCRSST